MREKIKARGELVERYAGKARSPEIAGETGARLAGMIAPGAFSESR